MEAAESDIAPPAPGATWLPELLKKFLNLENVPDEGLSVLPEDELAPCELESFSEIDEDGSFVERDMEGGTLEEDEPEEPTDSVIGLGTVVAEEETGFGLGAPNEITGGPLEVGVLEGALESETTGIGADGGGPDELREMEGPLEDADAGGVVGRDVVLLGFEIISRPIMALFGLELPCDMDAEGGLLGVVRSIAPKSTASISPPELPP